MLYSGSVSGNEYDNASIKFGAGVHLGANASFTMHGGSISDNKTAGYGGGVCMCKARSTSFTMTGGTIAENSAGHDGGGVYVKNGAFTMTGGSITDNTVGNGCNGGECVCVYERQCYLVRRTGHHGEQMIRAPQ